MVQISSIHSNSLSFFRTSHEFSRYGEFYSCEDFIAYYEWAKSNGVKIYILGNGSNTLFSRQKVSSLILKNKLSKSIKLLSERELEVSSSTLVIDVLKYCYKSSFESFYYLSSVPASIGGALAMNAGRGRKHDMTIYDFVKTITFFNPKTSSIETIRGGESVKDYRETIFTGIQSSLILSAVFKFEETSFNKNPILERCRWSKENQDYSAANCGSIFKKADARILNRVKGVSIGNASFSKKTNNWIVNNSGTHMHILLLITLVSFFHNFFRREIELEVIAVD